MSSLPRRFLQERRKRNLFRFWFQRTRFTDYPDSPSRRSGMRGQSVDLSERAELWDFNVRRLVIPRTVFKFLLFKLCKVSCVPKKDIKSLDVIFKRDIADLGLFLQWFQRSLVYQILLCREFMVSFFSYSKILEVSPILIFECFGFWFSILRSLRFCWDETCGWNE